MRKAPKNLLNTKKIVEQHPEMEEQLHGIGAVYGKIIFLTRMEKGLTQKELAEKAGVGDKTITRAEGGSENLGTLTYDNIFKALDLSTVAVAELMYHLTRQQGSEESLTVFA